MLLPDVARAYDELLDRELRPGARRRSAARAPLSGRRPAQMVDARARRLAGKDVLVDSEVDPELVGGVVLDVGGNGLRRQRAHTARAHQQDHGRGPR